MHSRRALLLGATALATLGMSRAQRETVLTASGNRPIVSLDFTTGILDPAITFTRAGSAWYFDGSGTLRAAGANVPRFDYGPGVTNYIRNNSMIGAVAGTPGTMPTNWALSFIPSGVTSSIQTGVANGAAYIDLTVSGTAGSTANASLAFELPSGIACANGQVWTSSVFAQLISGVLPASVYLAARVTDASFVITEYLTPTVIVGSGGTRFSATYTLGNASDAFIKPCMEFAFQSGVAYSFTIRIAAPQLERGAVASSPPNLTFGAAATQPPGAINWLRNNSMVGAGVGTPGTLPNNWSQNNSSGLTANVVALGTESGIPYVDIQIVGTTAGGQGNNIIMEVTTQIPALNAQVWTGSSYVKLAGGSLSNVSNLALQVQMLSAAGASLGTVQQIFTPTAAALSSQRVTNVATLNNASTAFVRQYIAITSATPPVAVDLTLRIGGPQLEIGFTASPLILTSGVAVNASAPLGMLVEEARTNSIRNNSMTGAVVGTPGTLPTFWSQGNGTGLTANVVGTGIESGIPYIDLQISGTTATGNTNIVNFEAGSPPVAAQNQIWSHSLYCKLIAGSLTNIQFVRCSIQTYTSIGGALSVGSTTFVPTSAPLASQRINLTYTLPDATTGLATGFLQVIANTAPVAVNLTLRIGAPQLELGSFITSPILTTAAAVTRNVAVSTMPLPATFKQNAYTMLSEVQINVSNPAIGIPFQIDDNVTGNRSTLYLQALNPAIFTNTGTSAGLAGAAILGAPFKLAGSFTPGRQVGVTGGGTGGGAVSGGSAATLPSPVSVLRLGDKLAGAQPFNGYLRRSRIWPSVFSDPALAALVA